MTADEKKTPQETPSPEEFASLFNLDRVTSPVISVKHPPKDWADVVMLVPHEAVRRECAAMAKSTDKLAANVAADEYQDWQGVLLAEWFVNHFYPVIHGHHDNEELIYFPWIMSKCTPEEAASNERMSKSHEEMMELMDDMKAQCQSITDKKGLDVKAEVAALNDLGHKLHEFMKEHMGEEEEVYPPIVRKYFTPEEEQVVIGQIIQREGLIGLRNFFPAIAQAMKEWASPAFNKEFWDGVPPPVREQLEAVFVPDYHSFIVKKRDAPFATYKPDLVSKFEATQKAEAAAE